MFNLFKTDPAKKLRKQANKLYKEAMEIQRSGDLKLYAKKMSEVEELEAKIAELKKSA
ncbi:DUF6435 family protein [Fulvivirga lutea]|uniref:Lacal_2735 family protein n=1 Tax=Fulvivirga lutea TaxID=2810512 RepID=A0A974WDH1_9BACT|nr:DUF6435 family protein [Fulvivirga lutea]QSE96044.1 Lacal_2735 family protein [Fulvivirga lutea]